MREAIRSKITELENLIIKTNIEIQELVRQDLLLCDDDQQFVEKMEKVVVSKRPFVEEERLIGRIYWDEYFTDDDTGEKITINRCQTVRVDGIWVV